MAKVIAVVGATGNQGGGLVRAIGSGDFVARVITRNASSVPEWAQNAAVVEADLDDPSWVDAAFAGAYGAYCGTSVPEKEIEHARTMALAVEHHRSMCLCNFWPAGPDWCDSQYRRREI